MARRRRPPATAADLDTPEWLWNGCDVRLWLREHGGQLDGFHQARLAWHATCQAWLLERGLVMIEHPTFSYDEYRRICREEPHRVVRRPA
jgi:hypothetical protein